MIGSGLFNKFTFVHLFLITQNCGIVVFIIIKDSSINGNIKFGNQELQTLTKLNKTLTQISDYTKIIICMDRQISNLTQHQIQQTFISFQTSFISNDIKLNQKVKHKSLDHYQYLNQLTSETNFYQQTGPINRIKQLSRYQFNKKHLKLKNIYPKSSLLSDKLMQQPEPKIKGNFNATNPAQQQNININISYNLNTNKISPSILPLKKAPSKSKKIRAQGIQGIGNQFFNNLALNGIHDNKKASKKQNVSKKSNQVLISSKQARISNDKRPNQVMISSKQARISNQKKPNPKRKKSKNLNNIETNPQPEDAVIEYYNPLANNSKDFLKRNIQSPDIFKAQNNRKIKTQASCYEIGPLFKKSKKLFANLKDPSNTFQSKNAKINNGMKQSGYNFISSKNPLALNNTNLTMKKSMTQNKTPKNKKSISQLKEKQKRMITQESQIPNSQSFQSRHNKSCMLYSTKKQGLITEPNLVQTAEHIISTYASVHTTKINRKRAQSAYIFSRNDKQLVSKILNMSIISSQLGSSQLISSERMKSARNGIANRKFGLKVDQFDQYTHYQNQKQIFQAQNKKQSEEILPGNALRQYLNSIDLRIMKNIEDDTADIISKGHEKVLQKRNLKIKQEGKQSQRPFLKYVNQNSVPNSNGSQIKDFVAFYNQLFQNALNNKKIHQEQQMYLDSAKISADKENQFELLSSSKLRKQKICIQGFVSDQDQFNETQRKTDDQVQQLFKEQKPQKNALKLNFKNYKDLLNQQGGNFIKKKQDQQGQSNQAKQVSNFNFQLSEPENMFQFVPNKNNNSSRRQYNNNEQRQKTEHFQNRNDRDFSGQEEIQEDFKKLSKQHPKQIINPSLPQDEELSAFSAFKENQIQRWNNLNRILTKKIGEKQGKQTQTAEIMQQLIKQSNWNKRWIEQESSQLLERQKSENFVSKTKPNLTETKQYLQKTRQDIINTRQGLQQTKQQTKQTKKDIFVQNQKGEEVLISGQQNKISHQKNVNDLQNEGKKQNILKFPKHSNFQRNIRLGKNVQPSYSQVCWQYNVQQLQKQIQKYNKNSLRASNKQKNINNSPNNFSEDGNGSGEEEYDSKKYSEASLFRDKVLEDNSDKQILAETVTDKRKKRNNHSDSLDQDEDQQISYEQKQINSANRWVNPSDIIGITDCKRSTQNEGRIRKFRIRPQKVQIDQNPSDNYLECQLSNFGVKNHNHQDLNANILHKKQDFNQTSLIKLQKSDDLLHVNQVLMMIDEEQLDIQNRLKTMIRSKKTQQMPNKDYKPQKSPLLQEKPSNNVQGGDKQVSTEIKRKRLTHIVEDIILQMIKEFVRDISYILKKSSSQQKRNKQFEQNSSPFRTYKQSNETQNELSPFYRQEDHAQSFQHQTSKVQQSKKSNFVGKCFGIDTSFTSVQRYLKQFKLFLVQNLSMKQDIIKNINKDIGPNSLEILSYLRPEYDNLQDEEMNCQNGSMNEQKIGEQQNCQDEDGLFVISSDVFSQFENYLQLKIQEKNKGLQPEKQLILTQKQKRNTNFWHRCIYESWNQFLDFQRPYGINGKPYEWVQQRKKFRQVKIQEIQTKLQKGVDKLLEAISLPSGIIYDKFDVSCMYSDLNEEQKMFLNEQRLSRMLAIELFESQQTWVNYNDQMAQLLVELSRIVEERVYFQLSTELKKLSRKRYLLVNGEETLKIQTDQIQNEQLLSQLQNAQLMETQIYD